MKRHKVLFITLGLILLFAITILATNLILNAVAKKDVQIPNLVGKEQNQAKSETESLKLIYEVKEEAFNKDVPEGCIISQEPPYMENYVIKEETIISVVVSKGRNLVTVPKVIGVTKDEALEALEALDLLVNVVEEYDKKVEAGYVIKQDIEAKEEIDAGETITITVSKGVEKVVVPDLIGKTEDEAKSIIKDNGLKLKQVYTDIDESKADGVVLYQDLEVNTEVEKDSYINITINSLPTEKKGTINVNVKSLLDGKVEYEEVVGNEIGEAKVKKVKLEIRVNDSTIYSEEVNPQVESITAEFTNKGWVDIKVLIDGIKKSETGMYLEDQTSITID